MRRLVLLALAALLPTTALAAVSPPPTDNGRMTVVRFAAPPSRVSCQDRDVVVVESAPIHPQAWQQWTPVAQVTSSGAALPLSQPGQSFVFSVDADGAVTDLKRGPGFTPWRTDGQAAAIASWRFAPNAPAKGCRFDLAPVQTTLAETAPAQLFEILAFERRAAPPAVRQALEKAGDCGRAPRRAPRVMAYPDLRDFNDKSISPAWAGVRYDIDANGVVRDVRIVAQGGDMAFAKATASSIAKSRFQSGSARTGCFAALAAKPKATPRIFRPDIKTFERPGDACEISREALNLPQTKAFPPVYAAHGVTGWAIVRFDVAPWGQIGNVEVVASQPTEAFGAAARGLIQNARPAAPATGYRGCLAPVVYDIPAPEEDLD